MSSLFETVDQLPSGIKIMIMRKYAELKTNEIREQLMLEAEGVMRSFCDKCGEHCIMLSTLQLCQGCVQYGYSINRQGLLDPHDAGHRGEAILSNNLFGLDLFV